MTACAGQQAVLAQADPLAIAQAEWELNAGLDAGTLGAPIKGQASPSHNVTHKNNSPQERLFYLAGRILTAAAPLCGDNIRQDYALGVRIKPLQALQVSIPLAVKAFDEQNDIAYGDYLVGVDGVPLNTGLLGFKQLMAIEWVGAKENKPLTLNLERGRGKIPVNVRIIPSWRCAYAVHYLATKNFDAYADGDSINFTAAAINTWPDDNELAFIIGHEISHNILRHPQRGEYNRRLAQLAGLLLGALVEEKLGGDWQDEFGNIGTAAAHEVFTPAQEKEADYLGAYLMTYAGFLSPKAVDAIIHTAVIIPNGIHENGDHPGVGERLANIRLAIAEIQAKQKTGQPLLPQLAY